MSASRRGWLCYFPRRLTLFSHSRRVLDYAKSFRYTMISSSARHDLRSCGLSVGGLGGCQSDRALWLTAIRTARRKQALFIGFGSPRSQRARLHVRRPWLLYYVNGGPAARVLSCLCVANSCFFSDEVQDRNMNGRINNIDDRRWCASLSILWDR